MGAGKALLIRAVDRCVQPARREKLGRQHGRIVQDLSGEVGHKRLLRRTTNQMHGVVGRRAAKVLGRAQVEEFVVVVVTTTTSLNNQRLGKVRVGEGREVVAQED